MFVLEMITAVPTESEAHTTFALQLQLDGSIGGRVLPPKYGHKDYRVQLFLKDVGVGVALPDGVIRRFVPDSQRAAVGIYRC